MSNTEIMDPAARIYLKQISKTPLLTLQEEAALADRIKKGDIEARDHMIKANLRLVVKIAQDYANYGLPLLDLISEGNIGLMKAVERFDPNKGGKLSTYAAWWIKQSIKRALSNQSKTIRLPVHMNDKIAKMRRVVMAMSEELGREPTDEEMSEELGIDRAKFAAMKSYSMRPASLDAPISDDGPEEFGEIIADENALTALQILVNKNNHMQLDDLLEVLDERERKIIDARFGLAGQRPKTLEEVGEEFGRTRERIRQLQNIALRKMRRALEKKEKEQPKVFIGDQGANFFGEEEDEDDIQDQQKPAPQTTPTPRQIMSSQSRKSSSQSNRIVRKGQPLGGKIRNDSLDLQKEMREELLRAKRKEVPTLEEWRSLPEMSRQVFARYLGFNGLQFSVENGLNFREIGAMLHITADEAKSIYDEAMIFLERSRAHISLPETVDEYERKVAKAEYTEAVGAKGTSATRHAATEHHEESSDESRPTSWWKQSDIKGGSSTGTPTEINSENISREETSLETGEINEGMLVESGIGTAFMSYSESSIGETSLSSDSKEKAVEEKIKRLLNNREYRIVEARIGLNGVRKKTLEELGGEFGCTRENIRLIQKKALKKIASFFQISPSSLENLLQPNRDNSKNEIEDTAINMQSQEQKERLVIKKPVLTSEQENTLFPERRAEAEKVRAIFHLLSGTDLAVARKFWGEKEGDVMSSLAEIMRDLQMKSVGNVSYYITKIRNRLARKSFTLGDNGGGDTSSTKTFSDAQDSLIVGLYNSNNLAKLAEDMDMPLEDLQERVDVLQLESFYAHIHDLENGEGGYLSNRDFAQKYGIDIGWLESGKRASQLLYNEASSKGIEGSEYYESHVLEGKDYSPHTQALLLRAYKSKFPSRDCSAK